MMSRRTLAVGFLCILTGLFFVSSEGSIAQQRPSSAFVSLPQSCSIGAGKTGAAPKHLALLVGIDDYAAGGISDLRGPGNDLKAMYKLLTAPEHGFRLEPGNICLLHDKYASLENFLYAYKHFLIDQANDGDHVTVYFAGHGGQIPDFDEIEGDGRDETVLFYNSLLEAGLNAKGETLFVPQLSDDALGLLLEELNTKLNVTAPGRHALTVILDSCNSLSATRDTAATRFQPTPASVKYAPLERFLGKAGLVSVANQLAGSDRGAKMAGLAPSGAVILSAAGDGSAAYESNRHGVFTTALVEALASRTEPVTYRQLEWLVLSSLKVNQQTPAFHGSLDALFLSAETRGSGTAHTVSQVNEDEVTLAGVPTQGMGRGAEFKIYEGSKSDELGNPAEAIALMRVTDDNALNPRGKLISVREGAEVEPGDKAILASVSPEARKLHVSISSSMPDDLRAALHETRQLSEDAMRGIELVQSDQEHELYNSDYEIVLIPSGETGNGEIAIVDANGNIRTKTHYSGEWADQVINSLIGLARQKALLSLKGEGGGKLFDQQSVRVSLIPYDGPGPSQCRPDYEPFGPPVEVGENQFEIPICSRYKFVVEANAIDRELQVGLLFLAEDGSIFSIPGESDGSADYKSYRLSPPSATMPGNLTVSFDDVYQSYPPIGVGADLLVFAVDAKTPLPWYSLAHDSKTRSGITSNSALFHELNSYLENGTRSGPAGGNTSEAFGIWTVTHVSVKTVTNAGFEPGAPGEPTGLREYTIPGFQIDAYLPSNTRSALFRVLSKAHELATRSASYTSTNVEQGEDAPGQGFPYKQHEWCAADDAGNIDFNANLEYGIDCSRAIWYAFTQAGLPYSGGVFEDSSRKACLRYGAPGNDYLATSDMAKPTSALTENFESCLGQDVKIGDVLVYRNDAETMGHTVMVIDPKKRVAWGSHGWDGNENLTGYSDTGVEYQKMGARRDWDRWDKEAMKVKACWRHKAFVEDRKMPYFEVNGSYWYGVLCDSPSGTCWVE